MVVAKYGQPPCQADEFQGEMQGAPGFLCAPKCDPSTYSCPLELPYGTSAQPQCMLQDADQGAFCGLVCDLDSQCPSGSRCRHNEQVGVGVCIFPVSFNEWAHAGTSHKFAMGWPSQPGGKPPASFQISKTFASLQALKSKYAINDGDADMLTVKEFLSSLSAASGYSAPAAGSGTGFGITAGSPASAPPQSAGAWDFAASRWKKDVKNIENRLLGGVGGIESGIHDTIWSIEHIENRGVASTMLRTVIILFLAYLGLGCLIKSQLQGARGLDMVPHIGFWVEYPKLVVDGIRYAEILVYGALGKKMGSGGARGGRGGTGYFEEL